MHFAFFWCARFRIQVWTIGNLAHKTSKQPHRSAVAKVPCLGLVQTQRKWCWETCGLFKPQFVVCSCLREAKFKVESQHGGAESPTTRQLWDFLPTNVQMQRRSLPSQLSSVMIHLWSFPVLHVFCHIHWRSLIGICIMLTENRPALQALLCNAAESFINCKFLTSHEGVPQLGWTSSHAAPSQTEEARLTPGTFCRLSPFPINTQPQTPSWFASSPALFPMKCCSSVKRRDIEFGLDAALYSCLMGSWNYQW